LRSELSTWFALESDDIVVPSALNAKDKHGDDPNRNDRNLNEQNSELDSLPHTLIQLKDGFVRFDERTVFENLRLTKMSIGRSLVQMGQAKPVCFKCLPVIIPIVIPTI